MSAKLVWIVGFCAIGAALSTNCGGRTPIGGEPIEGTGIGGTAGNGTGGAIAGGGAGSGGTYGSGGIPGTGGTYGSGGYAGGYGGAGGYAGTLGSGGYAGFGGAGGYAGGSGGAGGYAGTYGSGGYAGGYGGAGGFAGGYGGSTGSGGATPPGCRNAPLRNEDLVDDMNDGDSLIIFTNGRAGAWTTYHDTLTPNTKIFPDGVLSMSYTNDVCHGFAAHVVGGPFAQFAGFSAGLGGPYNATAYRGLTFWAMSVTNTTLRVAFPDIDTDPAGARCSPAGGATGCFDHWGSYVVLNSGWNKITVLFTSLQQDGWGNLAPTFRADTVFSAQFNIAAPQSIFDVWVDDVALLR